MLLIMAPMSRHDTYLDIPLIKGTFYFNVSVVETLCDWTIMQRLMTFSVPQNGVYFIS